MVEKEIDRIGCGRIRDAIGYLECTGRTQLTPNAFPEYDDPTHRAHGRGRQIPGYTEETESDRPVGWRDDVVHGVLVFQKEGRRVGQRSEVDVWCEKREAG